MPPITDPQIARMFERLEVIARDIAEIKPLLVDNATLRRDLEHLASSFKQLSTMSEMRGNAIHQIDKRVLVLERWHKAMIGFTGIAFSIMLAMGGYAKQFIDSIDDDRNDTRHRITALEFIISSPQYERAMEKERPVAAGSK